MNFKITSGSNNSWLEKEPRFIKLYNDGELTTRNIKKLLELTENEYRQLRRKCISDGSIVLRKPGRRKENSYKTNPKNYSKSLSKGIPYFRVTHNGVYFCNVKKRRHAELIVERLRECGWDKSQVPRILEEVMME